MLQLFSGGAQLYYCGCCVPSQSQETVHKIGWQAKDAFVETDQYVLTFLHSILVCRGGHTLSSALLGMMMLLPN
jgi:hypothetical protein